ncbi:MAG: retroviral-like aspartic protease family protein, partial [Amphritea sp.]|nr:retroviral-like aspartic protease family protein [Amphritea sp.]
MDTGALVSVETEPVKETDEVETADEEIPAGCKLLSIEGSLNGFSIKFLIDSGATDCFVSTAFVEEKKLEVNKRNEKVKINLADGTTRVSTKY